MANIIKGNRDGKNGGSDTYCIPGRDSNIPRKVVVKEIGDGKHPNFTTYTTPEGETFVKSKPNNFTEDNVNS
ncbi:hypothetical protein QUF74_09995 [Candidatus Halobeggiatoa sp. HSG11]|nr:hypothetical protein [Candidatus Halobeggiatoa sp. HSG11]